MALKFYHLNWQILVFFLKILTALPSLDYQILYFPSLMSVFSPFKSYLRINSRGNVET